MIGTVRDQITTAALDVFSHVGHTPGAGLYCCYDGHHRLLVFREVGPADLRWIERPAAAA